ncbi:MAG TPA: glycosyltransferase family 39 protein, partial [Acidobacteriaceae bacterium]|nr:glycosyltransferase family 39 protein [Acidobacteriaceae bacterium]
MPVFLSGTVMFAFLLRVVVVAGLLSHAPNHTIDYNDFGWESWEMGWTARSLFLGQGFSSPFLPVTGPTALVPPLYPYLLAGGFHLFGLNTIKVAFAVLSLNSLFSALTCLPLFFLTRRAINGRIAAFAALGWALYPFAIYFSATRVWDYALTSLLFTCCLLVAQTLHRRSLYAWVGFGALYGLTVLSNPSVTSLLPFLLLIAMYRAWKADRSRLLWLRGALLTSLAFLAVCAPWQIRNHRVMHADFFIRDGFWLEFYAGNNGDTHESNSAFAHPASNPVEMRRYQEEGEIRYMAEKRALSMDFVKHHPAFFAVATVRRVIRFWTGYWS